VASGVTWSRTWDTIVPAKPAGVWTWAIDYVKGPALLLIEATGEWSYSAGGKCGPNGDLNALVHPNEAILPGAPLGALLVKIGGSTAGTADGTVKVAGAKAIVEIGQVSGPVFLTINDELSGLFDNDGELTVTVSYSQLTPAAAAPAPAQVAPVKSKPGESATTGGPVP
jgi:hypothetical protein